MSARPAPAVARLFGTRARRRAAVVAAMLAFGLAGLATTPTAQADELRVLDSCVVTVTEGGQLALNPLAVQQPIINVLTPVDPLGVLVPAFQQLWPAQPPILLPGGQAVITGDEIANAVIDRLHVIPPLSAVLDAVTAPVRQALASTCAITVTPQPPDSPPPPAGGGGSPAPPAVGDPGTAPAPGAPNSAPLSRQPVSADAPGPAATLLPGYVVGRVPGVPGEAGLPPDGIPFNYENYAPAQPQIDPEQLALANSPGTAEALPAEGGITGIGRPVVLAALLVTLVGTQLLRRWLVWRSGE